MVSAWTHWQGAGGSRGRGSRSGSWGPDCSEVLRLAFPGSSPGCESRRSGITGKPPGTRRNPSRRCIRHGVNGKSARRLTFLPRYYGLAACELLTLAVLALLAARQGSPLASRLPPVLTGLTLIELACFGMGLNPAIMPQTQAVEPPLIARLRRGLESGERALGIGEELPPNVLMRFGLADPRNYDSVELARSLNWFAPLFEPGNEPLSSRGRISWQSADRARDRLEESCVKAVVGASPPPPGRFARVEQVSEVWIAWLRPAAWASTIAQETRVIVPARAGRDGSANSRAR